MAVEFERFGGKLELLIKWMDKDEGGPGLSALMSGTWLNLASIVQQAGDFVATQEDRIVTSSLRPNG